MALKDITLGQYFPGNSPVHRLDPRTKLLAVVLSLMGIVMFPLFTVYLSSLILRSRSMLNMLNIDVSKVKTDDSPATPAPSVEKKVAETPKNA